MSAKNCNIAAFLILATLWIGTSQIALLNRLSVSIQQLPTAVSFRKDVLFMGEYSLLNRSLGYNARDIHIDGMQCLPSKRKISMKNGTTYTMSFVPNRKPMHPETFKSVAILILYNQEVGPVKYIQNKLTKDKYKSWLDHFLEFNPEMVPLVLVHGNWTDIHAIAEHYNWTTLCDRFPKTTCQHLRTIDSGYMPFELRLDDGRRRLVLIGKFELPTYNQALNEASLAIEIPSSCVNHPWPQSYVFGTNAYALSLNLMILDYFDIFFKVDIDITFMKSDNPINFSKELFSQAGGNYGHGILLRAHPWMIEGEGCYHGLKDLLSFYVNMESAACGVPLVPYASDQDWFGDDFTTYASFLTGGWLGFWSSAELLRYASWYWNWEDGLLRHRWGDQEFWLKAFGLFLDENSLVDVSWGLNSSFTPFI